MAMASTPSSFPQFDVATDDSDHHFSSYPSVASGPSFVKAILNEWIILQNGLPPSIYVRVYEKRMELLRAAIVGPAGTPYHDGLFFFDVAFPSDYPKSPPKVRYRSFGYYLNPNLNSNGKVCLSLLNTWHGKESEMWVPGKSTILQVLVSLQGLVLNEKPVYNDPVDPLFFSWKTFNNMVFVDSCKTMLCLLRNPPKGFEGFVRAHFRERSRNILSACQVYMNGFVRAGQYQENQKFLEDRVKLSGYFKHLFLEQYNRLGAEFRKSDASLDGFLVELKQIIDIKKRDYKLREKENQPLKKMRRIVQKTVNLVFNGAKRSSGVSPNSKDPEPSL